MGNGQIHARTQQAVARQRWVCSTT